MEEELAASINKSPAIPHGMSLAAALRQALTGKGLPVPAILGILNKEMTLSTVNIQFYT